jgi:hypothetical protein
MIFLFIKDYKWYWSNGLKLSKDLLEMFHLPDYPDNNTRAYIEDKRNKPNRVLHAKNDETAAKNFICRFGIINHNRNICDLITQSNFLN